jgi:hypothetical protein
MARFFQLDEAAETLPELRGILTRLRDQRGELIRLRDEVLEQQAAVEAGSASSPAGRGGEESVDAAELRRVRLRMQGVIDQMQAGVARIDELGITLREIESGLVDFPALVNGRQVWLCWQLGEEEVGFWHELSTGFGSRRPLAELE